MHTHGSSVDSNALVVLKDLLLLLLANVSFLSFVWGRNSIELARAASAACTAVVLRQISVQNVTVLVCLGVVIQLQAIVSLQKY